MLIVSLCAADQQVEKLETQKLLQSLFSGIDFRSYPTFRIIDLEELFDSSAQIEKEFRALSDEDKEDLYDTIEGLNKLFSHELQSILFSEDPIDDESNLSSEASV